MQQKTKRQKRACHALPPTRSALYSTSARDSRVLHLMASTKKARPRRVVPSPHLIWLNLRTRRKLSGFLLLIVGVFLWLFGRTGSPRAIAEEGVAAVKRQLKFDREREQEGVVSFPALEELVDRDRLWPPDLCECSPVSALLTQAS